MIWSKLPAFVRVVLAATALAGAGVADRAEAGPTLVIEAESGRVLHAIDAFEPWYPASVAKVMTAYLVFRAIEAGRITMDTPILISDYAASQFPSKMGFPPGTAVTVDDALRMLMVKSANDIAVALAEGVSGSVAAFAEEANKEAAALGMTGTRFVNPHGWHDDRQFTNAHDLALLARGLLKRYPQHAAFYDLPAIRVGKRLMRNSNNMIGKYDGLNGLKTGYTCPSGLNIVATASRHGRQLIAVVLGAKSGVQRAEIAASILEEGFASPVSSFAAERIDTMSPPATVRPGPVDLRPAVCGPRKKATPEDLQLVAVDPRIDLERGRRALGHIEETDEGEGSPLVEQGPPAVATFSTAISGGLKASSEPAADQAKADPKPAKPARAKAKVAAKPKPEPKAAEPKVAEKPDAGEAKPAASKAKAKAAADRAEPKAAAKPASDPKGAKPAAKPEKNAQVGRGSRAEPPVASAIG